MENSDKQKEQIENEINKALQSGVGPKAARIALAFLSGLVPGVGGVFGAGAGAWSESEQERINKIFASWLKLQEDEIKEIGITLMEVMMRIDKDDERIQERIQSPEYLKLIKKCFRDWSAAESEEKRILIRNLLCNAAGGEKICGDDIIRMFIEWIGRYTEKHFLIVKEIYKNEGITRLGIWQNLYGEPEREDSPEADLYKTLMHDLSVGHVIRQHRDKDYMGNFLKKAKQRSSGSRMKSAFDDEEE